MSFYERHKKKIWFFIGFAIVCLIAGTIINGVEPVAFNQ